jgi:histidinol-phosphate aminotransferase
MQDVINKDRDVKKAVDFSRTNRRSLLSPDVKKRLPVDDVINSCLASEKITNAVQHFLKAGVGHDDLDYHLKNLSLDLSRYAQLPEERVRIYENNDAAVKSIIRAFKRDNSNLLVCGPAENSIGSIAGSLGVGVKYHYAPTPFECDYRGIISLADDYTGFIYLGNPNTCTGTVYGIEEIESILNRVPGGYLILDESFYEYYGISVAGLASQYDKLFVIRSFLAVFEIPELSCSYLLTGAANIAAINCPGAESKPSALSLVAADASLNDLQYLARKVEVTKENMAYLSIRLRSLGVWCRITPADFLLINVSYPERVVELLRKENIRFRNLDDIPQLSNYVAVKVADDIASARIIEAFEKMPQSYYLWKHPTTRVILRRQRKVAEQKNKPGEKQKRNRSDMISAHGAG